MNFTITILWSPFEIGFEIELKSIPMSKVYFWPRYNGWAILQAELNSKNWVTELESTLILNEITGILNYWIIHRDKLIYDEFIDSFPHVKIVGIYK